jgi:hypothetical protein
MTSSISRFLSGVMSFFMLLKTPFFIFVTKLADDRGLSISPIIVLMRPSFIVLALVNKMGRTRLTCGKNIGGDSELRLNLGL